MTFTSIHGVRISAIAAAVPETTRTNADIGGPTDREYVQKLSQQVGVRERRIARPGQFGSDLGRAAASAALDALGWTPDDVDLVVVATQTPDRLFPGIAFSLHRQLGFRQSIPVFDINLGCSAFTHGLWVASTLLAGVGTRALLINTDTMSRTLGASDVGNQVLFGDAGTATALELSAEAPAIHAVLWSDGKGTESVCFPHSAMSATPDTVPEFVINGPAVLGLALRSVPRLVTELLNGAALSVDEVGMFVPHQANVFILDKLSAKLGLDPSRVVLSMDSFGNTSSASIPLAMSARHDQVADLDRARSLLVGFGTGFSLSAVLADLNATVMVPPVEVA